jgi:hypothetical protein
MIRSTLTIAVAIAFAVPTMGSAQTNDELTQRIADLEARLNQMEQEQVSFVNTIATAPVCATDTCSDTCGGCGDTGCRNRSWCCPEAGAFGEIELLYMSLKDTDDDINQDKLYSGTRTTVGYMNDKGRGFQIRYFEIGIAEEDVGGDRFDLDTLDFEYTSRFKLGCNWRGDFAMGLRLMDLDTAEDGAWEDAVGPVIGVNLIGEMTNNLSVYGRVRQAFVYGTNESDNNEDSVVPMSELAFGLEYARQLNSSEMYLRGGVEGQVFESAQDEQEDISIIGLGMSVGFRR